MESTHPRPLVFWQPILSIHQTPLLEALANIWGEQVYLVVDIMESKKRSQNSGWSVKPPKGIHLLKSGNEAPASALHIVSGFYGTSEWRNNRRRVLSSTGSEVWVAAEPLPTWEGTVKTILRFAKHGLARARLGRKLTGFLAIGDQAAGQAKYLGVSSKKIFPYCYVTGSATTNSIDRPTVEGPKKMLFVGRIIKRKGVDALFASKFDNNVSLQVIGNQYGEDIEIPSSIEYLGVIPNEEIDPYIRNAEALILPSLFDGWGAVVNEALTMGTPVIVTRTCGASQLVGEDSPYRGEVIEADDPYLIELAAKSVLSKKIDHAAIRDWAASSISAQVVAEYLVSLLKGRKVQAPWR